jgi:molybdenum cofactor biosynthesis protein B
MSARDDHGGPVALRVAVLTVSDTRGPDNDTSGDFLAAAAADAGHAVAARALVADDIYRIRAVLSAWIADAELEVVLVTGGTGFAGRDSTPEAVAPLFDKHIVGFGEVFRALSLAEIGSSTVQSRALAGMANGTLIFCMPGSTGACRTAWEGILREQLDSRHRPCNFTGLLRGQ